MTEALERYLQRKHAVLRQATQIPVALPEAEAAEAEAVEADPPALVVVRPTRAQQEQAAHRAQRLARYEEVMALHTAGQSLRAIARQTGLAKRTVQRYVHAEGFLEIARRGRRPTLLTPYVPYLQERWTAGCHNAQQLFLELRAQGFSGGRTIVAAFLRQWRTGPRLHARPSRSRAVPAGSSPCPAYSARQTCWLLLKDTALLEAEEQAYLTRLLQACPQIAVAQALVKEFATVLKEHDVAGLYSWLRGAQISGIAELKAVAQGMWVDRAAIKAAVTLPWSQGQVEGHVNRLKVLKRQGYGRCGFDLLRRRVLHRAS